MITLNIKRVIPVKKDDWLKKKNIISNKIYDYIEYQTRNSSKKRWLAEKKT